MSQESRTEKRKASVMKTGPESRKHGVSAGNLLYCVMQIWVRRSNARKPEIVNTFRSQSLINWRFSGSAIGSGVEVWLIPVSEHQLQKLFSSVWAKCFTPHFFQCDAPIIRLLNVLMHIQIFGVRREANSVSASDYFVEKPVTFGETNFSRAQISSEIW